MRRRKSALRKKIFPLLSLLLLFCAGVVSYILYAPEEHSGRADVTLAGALEESAPTIIYPRLYSATHISSAAIESDPRLRNSVTFGREDLVANVSSSIQLNRPAPESVEPERGTWLWTPLLEITPAYRDSVISGARKRGVKTIYLSLDSYLDIHVLPSPEKELKQKQFDRALETFVAQARKNGMTVDAEAGWQNWAEPGHQYKPFAVLDYAIEFNKMHAEKLRGFQYDVEPYLLPRYPKEKKDVLRNFLTLISETVTKLDQSDLEFSVVIPDFYDGQGETPRFLYAGRIRFAYDHLLHVLERRPGSKILVMAYRNFTEGRDGSLAISKDEVTRANEFQTKVVIAQETGDFPPPYITFYNTSRARYEKEMNAIDEAYAKDKSYGGLATHYLNTLIELE